MTISLPGSSKKGIGGLFGRKSKTEKKSPTAEKQLSAQQIAQMFNKDVQVAKEAQPTKLNASEKLDRDEMSSLRGALYSGK